MPSVTPLMHRIWPPCPCLPLSCVTCLQGPSEAHARPHHPAPYQRTVRENCSHVPLLRSSTAATGTRALPTSIFTKKGLLPYMHSQVDGRPGGRCGQQGTESHIYSRPPLCTHSVQIWRHWPSPLMLPAHAPGGQTQTWKCPRSTAAPPTRSPSARRRWIGGPDPR